MVCQHEDTKESLSFRASEIKSVLISELEAVTFVVVVCFNVFNNEIMNCGFYGCDHLEATQ